MSDVSWGLFCCLVVWSEGDRCQVRWLGDGELYSAKIQKIRKEGGRVTAMVAFDGFASDEDEEYSISDLQSLQEAPAASALEKSNIGKLWREWQALGNEK